MPFKDAHRIARGPRSTVRYLSELCHQLAKLLLPLCQFSPSRVVYSHIRCHTIHYKELERFLNHLCCDLLQEVYMTTHFCQMSGQWRCHRGEFSSNKLYLATGRVEDCMSYLTAAQRCKLWRKVPAPTSQKLLYITRNMKCAMDTATKNIYIERCADRSPTERRSTA